MKIFLPFRGEFGHICMWHAPQVKAYKGPKAVVIEHGMEPLYPDCQYFYIEKRPDIERREHLETEVMDTWREQHDEVIREYFGHVSYCTPSQEAKREYFIPQVKDIYEDRHQNTIALAPRLRQYGADNNWKHWDKLVESLGQYTKVAVGDKDTSQQLDCWRMWGLGETIAVLKNCKLLVTTDCGVAHLGVMCGTPIAMISHGNGLVADGTVNGAENGIPYGPIKMERYQEENHTNSMIEIIKDSWHSHWPIKEFCDGWMG